MPPWVLLAASIVVGALIPLQTAANAKLGAALAQPLWSALVALCVSAFALVIAITIARAPAPTTSAAVSVPVWCWFGGIAGAVFVAAGVFLVPKIGAANFLVGTIAGQLVLAVLIDHMGWLGVETTSMDGKRAIGVVFVLCGTLLFGLSKR